MSMKPQLLVAAALTASLAGAGLALAPGLALAQDQTTTSSIGPAEAAQFLKKENIQDFYTDPNLKTMKSADEVKRVFEAMNADDKAKMKAACAANEQSRFADLCKNIGTM
jgi:hypothetical protein